MNRPSFQFYPGDWLSSTSLSRCSHALKGIWIDILCRMHDADEYGVLRWPLEDIAQAAGCKVSDLRALQAKGVLKGADTDERCAPFIYTPRHAGKDGEPFTLIAEQDGPVWYSSRMVKDEHIRQNRGAGTRFEATPEVAPEITPEISPNLTPKGGFGYGSSTSSSKEKNTKKENSGGEYSESFLQFWGKYPSGRKGNKDNAYSAWKQAVKRASETEILAGLEAYCQSDLAKTNPKGAAAWLNDDRWTWDYTVRLGFGGKPALTVISPVRAGVVTI